MCHKNNLNNHARENTLVSRNHVIVNLKRLDFLYCNALPFDVLLCDGNNLI